MLQDHKFFLILQDLCLNLALIARWRQLGPKTTPFLEEKGGSILLKKASVNRTERRHEIESKVFQKSFFNLKSFFSLRHLRKFLAEKI